jgi:hypothetical protein
VSAPDVPAGYVRLALAADRLRRGLVDTWTGPAAIRRRVEAGPPPSPAELAGCARRLRTQLPDAGLSPERSAWLDAQLAALATTAEVLTGGPLGFVAQALACTQVEPRLGDEDRYAHAHDELDRLLPGAGPLGWRWAAHRRRTRLPPALLPAALAAVSALLRAATGARVGLPAGERVDHDVVPGVAWDGLHRYAGGLRSTVVVSSGAPVTLVGLVRLLAHESYPGHHTDACRKQQALAGRPEAAVGLLDSPQALLAEGSAEAGLGVLDLAPEDLQGLAHGLGLRQDVGLALRVAAAAEPLGRVAQDAALLLHDRRLDVGAVTAHLARWGLQPPARAARSLRFLSDPVWRVHTVTYAEGGELVQRWLDARPAGRSAGDRLGELLDSQLTPAGLVEGELRARPRVSAPPGVGRILPSAQRSAPAVPPGRPDARTRARGPRPGPGGPVPVLTNAAARGARR